MGDDILNSVAYGLNRYEYDDWKGITYTGLVKKICEEYKDFSYTMTRRTIFQDTNICSIVKVYGKDLDKVYLLIRKWGTLGEWDPVSVSYSTYNLFKYEYPEFLEECAEDLGISYDKFKYVHYHELVIRTGKFSRIPQYKKFKLKYMTYNTELFDNKLSNKELLCYGNYADKARFEDLEKCGAYHWQKIVDVANGEHASLLMMKFNSYNEYNSSDMNINAPDMCTTLLHEMCHGYVEALYGTSIEPDGLDGATLFGLDSKVYGTQVKYHGKHFADACAMIAEKTGYPIQVLFNYGTTGDTFVRTGYNKELTKLRHTKWTEGVRTSGEQLVLNKEEAMGKTYVHILDKHGGEDFLKLKGAIVNYVNDIKKDCLRVYGVQVAIKTTESETRIGIKESDGRVVEYDINSLHDARYIGFSGASAEVGIYRMRVSKGRDKTGVKIYAKEINTSDINGQAQEIVDTILASYL